jgi:LuxR family maltose regulon positive regulatory protein
MSLDLLATKFYIPPTRQSHVPRPRLIRMFDARPPAAKLTLVSASAGYGKTALIAEWLARSESRAAWLSLDEGDNDPTRFLTYLVAALERVDGKFGSKTRPLLDSPQPLPPEAVLTALVNEMAAAPEAFVLVLDDYHAIEARPIHRQVEFLLDRGPPPMHLVIITREDPPLRLARLRARGQLVEIRQDDLRFSHDECAGLLRQTLALDLAADEVAALERRTEGWVAGLQLAALSLRSYRDTRAFVDSFAGTDRYVLDYLFEEVFQGQPPAIQSFLLATSILDRLTAPLCNAVTGRADGQAQLEALEKANLFVVPLDPQRRWYRYHRLFADLLHHQLRLAGEPPEEELHERAGRWYRDHDSPAEAVAHALRAKNWELAAELVDAASPAHLTRGEATTVVRWCRRLPAESLARRPGLSLTYAWALMLTSHFDDAGRVLDGVERAAGDEGALLGEVAAARAYRAQSLGEMERMVALSHRALALLPAANLNSRGLVALNLGIAYWHIGRLAAAEEALDEALPACQGAGNLYGETMAHLFLARALAVRGRLRQAGERLKALAESHGQSTANPLLQLDLGCLHYEWNDLEQADHFLQQALASSRAGGNLEFEVGTHMHLARLHLARQDPAAARQALGRAAELEESSPIPLRTRSRRLDMEVFAALWAGDLEAAGALIGELTPDSDAHSFYRFLGLTPARYALARGDPAEAATLLNRSIARARENGWTYGLIAALPLRALAASNIETALEFLGEALTLAEPEGYIRSLVEAGPGLVPLLQRAAQRGIAPGYVGEILSAFPADAAAHDQLLTTDGLILEPPSDRELEVLRLVAAGLSNRQIADQLVLSIGTVKSHLHHIYGKLDARNRAQAVDRARELHLI